MRKKKQIKKLTLTNSDHSDYKRRSLVISNKKIYLKKYHEILLKKD